jgi:lipopolysaccharide biosynthesis glycosyltransferase
MRRFVNETYIDFVNVNHDAIKARISIDPGAKTFNAGFMMFRFDRWRAERVTHQVEEWMALHEEFGDQMWTLGSQPPLLLTLYRRVEWVDEAWNFRAASIVTDERRHHASVIHWNGHYKPWMPFVNHESTDASIADDPDMVDERIWKRMTYDVWVNTNKRLWNRRCQPYMDIPSPLIWQDALRAAELDAEPPRTPWLQYTLIAFAAFAAGVYTSSRSASAASAAAKSLD